MRISSEHGRAWGYWKTPEVLRKAAKLHAPDINQLINLHAGPHPKVADSSALYLVRMKRSNALADARWKCTFDLAEVLAPSLWCKDNMPARYHQMRRWLRTLLIKRERYS